MPTRDSRDPPLETLALLWAVRETGSMEALSRGVGTPAALAAETELTPDAATAVVHALADLGLLDRVGDRYEVTNRALGFLATRDLRSIGSLPAALDAFDDLVALPRTLTADAPDRDPESGSSVVDDDLSAATGPPVDDVRLRNRLGAALATDSATVRARVTAAVRAAPSADRVLAIGDGSGVHAREFQARGIEATVLDGAAAIEAARPLLESAGVDATARPLTCAEPTPLAFGVSLLTSMEPAEARETVAAVAGRLERDGTLVLVEPLRNRLDAEAAVAVDVRRLAAGAGRCRSEDDLRSWFDAAGLSADVVPIPGVEAAAVVGRLERAVLED
ncbi:SAM-dependent methyltransferase [Halorubrum sp. JWXQ-INN 858]|uniref:SAM-dependent methyltransferase n=1 Tax=Halorubrum sp. JWXQ-INN 858 TaxID=2690782 RepID=UPI00135A1A27|nr:SAM-dependent methyltransferase [Halorubrum sp. JWXQ-INN 858]MWV65890.1 SAM-dependent methyltransferase [Halorubrum sp. JWXQ-INN 858]